MDHPKKISLKTKKILWATLILFVVSFILFLSMVVHYKLQSDMVLLVFFLYGVFYAGWFWLCTQIAYKLKNLRFGIALFVTVIVFAFGIFWMTVR
jgi:amino acid permease